MSELAGVAFRYHTSRHYYLFALRGGKEAVLLVRKPVETELRQAEWRQLGAAPFPYDSKQYRRLKVENAGPRIRASIDGKQVLEVSDSELLKGSAGLMANIPARFQDFVVSATE